MQTKSLSERIAEIKSVLNFYEEHSNISLVTFTDFSEAVEIIVDLQAENQALLSKNEELEDELETRRAFIVANPCAQCGGKINAMKCGAWRARAEELEERVRKLEATKL